MPQNYEVSDASKRPNPMLGLIGFIVIVIIGGFSFAVSAPVAYWLKTTTVVAGASGVKILPLAFPPEWPPIGQQLAVTVGLFLILFVLAMVLMFAFMRPSTASEMDVNMDVMRREAAAKKKRK